MPLTYKTAVRIAKDLGYKLAHQTGSHQQFLRGSYPVTIPCHQELAIGTAKQIIKRLAIGAKTDVESLIKQYQIKF